jgi:ligand-binding sensor domain-containing protein
MKTSLQPFSKLEVKATLQTADGVWLGTAKGLYRFAQGVARPLPSWRHEEVRAIGPAPDSFYAVVGSPPRQTIHRCDAAGAPIEEITPPAAENITAISGRKQLWLGTKRGIFKWIGERWQHVFQSGAGKAEVLWVTEHEDHLMSSVKKQGPDDRPALEPIPVGHFEGIL